MEIFSLGGLVLLTLLFIVLSSYFKKTMFIISLVASVGIAFIARDAGSDMLGLLFVVFPVLLMLIITITIIIHDVIHEKRRQKTLFY